MEQQGTQQLLRRYRWASRFGVQLAKASLQLPQSFISHGTQRTQGMVLRDSLFGAYVAEYTQLLLIISTHEFFIPAWPVETTELSA